MLKGFMDHWVPSQDIISKFWKSDIETVKKQLDSLKSEIGFNNFTFYTKWYTNGIKSDLSYLYNHPEASNVRTDNRWGRQIIDYLHENAMTAGAMLQLFTYEKKNWGEGMTIGEWDVRGCAQTDAPVVIADFTDDRYIERVKDIIREQLTIFPDLDYLFLEFEGIFPKYFEGPYTRWAAANHKPGIDDVHYDESIIGYCKKTSQQLDLLWSIEGQEMLKYYYGRYLKAVDELLKEIGYTGTTGIVYHIYRYEAFVYPDIIPDNSWWLLPWHYWSEDIDPDSSPEIAEMRKKESKAALSGWKQQGHKVCYIGDVTIVKDGLDPIREFYDYSREIGLDGYLGMGNPDPSIGLRWNGVDDNYVMAVRELYKTLYKTTIVMYMDDFSQLPEVRLPEGYTVRSFREGDEQAWDSIIVDGLKWRNVTFKKSMLTDRAYRPERIWFIFFGDTPVATASAWHMPQWGEKTGYLHNVGVIPEHRGKGLGYQVSLAALHQMSREGMESAILETGDDRLAPAKTYLKLGFRPKFTDGTHKKRWERLFERINNNEWNL